MTFHLFGSSLEQSMSRSILFTFYIALVQS